MRDFETTTENHKPLGRRVALFQHFLTHYREPIYNLLCRQAYPEPEYVIFADTSNKEQIKTIDYAKAQISPQNGGLCWKKISNIWFGRTFLWQTSVVQLAMGREFDCLIFLGNMYHFSTWLAAILARIKGKRVLMWTHGYLREERGMKGWLRERFYRLADGLLLYGHRAEELLLKRGFKSDSLYVVYNSLDYERQCAVREKTSQETLLKLRKSLFHSPELPVLVFVGRLTQQKKLSQLLEAVYILKEQCVLVNVVFVGDGPQKGELQQLVSKTGLSEQVVFYGPCYSEEELGPLLMLADICVSPGEVGLTCIHALTYGTPVITHNNPDFQMPEWEAVRPGITGDLFQFDDVRGLAKVMQKWLEQNTRREDIRGKCHEIIAQYYNPFYQVGVINKAVAGIAVDSGRLDELLADVKGEHAHG
jgi:glycosyltransferase involved in cell wall biosynthesis